MISLKELSDIVRQGKLTPEMRKKIEQGTYSSKDIADLIDFMVKYKSETDEKVNALEQKLAYKQTSSEDMYGFNGLPLPENATKSEISYGLKRVKCLHAGSIKDKSLSDEDAKKITKEYKQKLEEITKSSWWYRAKNYVCEAVNENPLAVGAIAGASLLLGAGIYAGSYLATAEIGGTIGAVIPPLVYHISDDYDLTKEGNMIGSSIFGLVIGATAACISYAFIDMGMTETPKVLCHGIISGLAGGIASTSIVAFLTKG